MTTSARPKPWAAYTTPEFWADEHISAQLLAAHLNPGWDAASRNHATIDRAAAWLAERFKMAEWFGLGENVQVLDLGCGPGLYAIRLARAGAAVTGLDVSPRSIEHARTTAAAEGLNCDFRVANYLTDDLGGPYDLALFSYEDVCVLSPTQRAALLRKVRESLTPGGVLAMDVTAAARFDAEQEGVRAADDLDGGFWAPSPYHGLAETWKYPERRLVLDHYTITKDGVAREFWNWTQCLTPAEVTAELRAAGFGSCDLYGDLAGAPYDEQAPSFAVLGA